MSTFAAIVLGLLIGWIIEWIIDWIYWRRRASDWLTQESLLKERVKVAEARSADLEHQMAIQKVKQTSPQERLAGAESDLSAARASEFQTRAQTMPTRTAEVVPEETLITQPAAVPATPVVHDDLVVIKGIGPVIAAKLNEAGIYSFADLAALTPERLRELVGKMISQLADEESIIEQAKQLAAMKSQGG